VLSESIGDAEEARRIASRIRAHVVAAGIGASVSVGFAIADDPDAEAASLIAEADLSMYRSRANGRHSSTSRAAHPSTGGASAAFDVVAVTAHELRTPLTTIIGFASTLRSNRDHMTVEAQDAAFDSLDRQANRLTDIVDQLLDLGQLRGTDMPPVTAIDVRDAIADALDVAPPSEPVTVTLGWARPTLAVSGHRSSISRLLVNLLTNAYKHGGAQVLIEAVGRGDLVDIIVEDDGPGVAPLIEASLFDPFTRGTGHGGSGPAGTGLGLAIAREIARSFGGDLVHERVDPHGARMRLSLPAARPHLRLAEAAAAD
jgi:signal transduction histidine kinase